MNFPRLFLISAAIAIVPARAVYAPIPEHEDDNEWTVSVRAGVMHDSNIFGAQANAISSTVYHVSPRIAYSGSLSDQTFAMFGYALTLDHFDKRPGDKTLDSHDISARIAHAFSATSNVDISNTYQIVKNPESLLAGLPLNTNQSYKRNELGARYVASPAPKWETVLKARSINYRYDSAALAPNLDRTENLFGGSVGHAFTQKIKLVGEYRYEDIAYRTQQTGNAAVVGKDKQSHFAMAGVDYAVARKFSLTSRVGNQWRDREGEQNTSGLYAEFSGKYDYAERSFLAGGYVYNLEETSNVALYNDTRVNRLFVNVQHAISPLLVASASVTYEPSQLQGRRGVADVDETTQRVGLAITWLPTPHWSFSASYDHDNVESEQISREQERERFGVSAAYAF